MADNDRLCVQAYDCPATFSHHVVTAIAFVPVNAKKYSNKSLPAPKGVRWGIVTCLRRDFVDLLGKHLSDNATLGSLKLRNGAIIREWVPVLLKSHIAIPIGQKDDAISTRKHLDGGAIYESDRYSLVLRSDVYELVRGFRFDGCVIKKAPADATRSLKKRG